MVPLLRTYAPLQNSGSPQRVGRNVKSAQRINPVVSYRYGRWMVIRTVHTIDINIYMLLGSCSSDRQTNNNGASFINRDPTFDWRAPRLTDMLHILYRLLLSCVNVSTAVSIFVVLTALRL